MRYYTGTKPCLGCGKTGKQHPRREADSLCSDCKTLISMGKEARERFDQVKNETSEDCETVIFADIRRGNSVEAGAVSSAFYAALQAMHRAGEKTNGKSRYIGAGGEGTRYRSGWLILKAEQADAMHNLYQEIRKYGEAAFKVGQQRGQNALFQLNAGEITLEQFNDRITKNY